jgi:tetratricopeptide (TPR) repeat protein
MRVTQGATISGFGNQSSRHSAESTRGGTGRGVRRREGMSRDESSRVERDNCGHEAPYQRGDYRAALAIAAEGLEQWPDHPVIHYQLACFHALAGDTEHALDHFERAIAGDSRVREWASSDSDLDSLRDDLRFAAITASRD